MGKKKNILLVGLGKDKDENNQQEVLSPEPKKKKHRHLFSRAVFSESFKSKRGSLFLVSARNALIMVVIMVIRSTLNINATSSSRKSRFSNANREKTIKQSTIGLYNGFSSSATAVNKFVSGEDERRTSLSSALSKADDKSLTSGLDSAKVAYKLAYSLKPGTEEEKNAAGKEAARKAIETVLDSSSSYTEEEKKAAKQIASSFFDEYAKDKNATTKDLLVKARPGAISTLRCVNNESKYDDVLSIVQSCFDKVYKENVSQDRAIQEAIYPLRKALGSKEELTLINPLTQKLDTAYNEDKSTFLKDKTKHNEIVADFRSDYICSSFEERMYYEYLPDFTVNYVTSDYGYPITYAGTGEYSESGNEIRKEREVKTYNPSVFVPVKGDRGTTSTRVEKRHKEAITGEAYTEEEISEAKKEAKEQRSILKSGRKTFLNAFRTRDENNTNRFYDGKNIIDSEIENAAVSFVCQRAEQQVIADYNDKNDVKISSIDEITSQNSSRNGKARRETVTGYAASSITSYKTYLKSAKNNGYDNTASSRIAMVKASQGVINQLPDKVGSSLSDRGNRNVYGIIVGRIGFARTTLLVPMVYSILLANDLVANKVETGSLAFTRSTPLTRESYIFTEAIFRIFAEIVRNVILFVFTVISRSIGIAFGGTDLITSLPRKHVACYSFGSFRVTLAISGICFLSSSIFNKSNKAIGIGGGITIFFFICSILGLFGTRAIPGTIRIDRMNRFNYRTIISFFDSLSVRDGNYIVFFLKLIGLLVIALVTYTVSGIVFTKKDLPL